MSWSDSFETRGNTLELDFCFQNKHEIVLVEIVEVDSSSQEFVLVNVILRNNPFFNGRGLCKVTDQNFDNDFPLALESFVLNGEIDSETLIDGEFVKDNSFKLKLENVYSIQKEPSLGTAIFGKFTKFGNGTEIDGHFGGGNYTE